MTPITPSLKSLKALRRREYRKLAARIFSPNGYMTWRYLRNVRRSVGTTEERVQVIVNFCRAHVPYYTRILDNLEKKQNVDFTHIPMLDKASLRCNFADLIARSASGLILGDPSFSIVQTSGSTGWPSSHIKGRNDRLNNIASLSLIFDEYAAPFFGNIYDLGLHWDGQPVVQGRAFPGAFICWNFEGYSFDLDDLKQEYLDILKTAQPNIIFGAPSRVVALCKFSEAHGFQMRPQLALLSYEELVKATETYLLNHLNCRVVRIYGVAETGILGWSCLHRRIHLNDRMYYFEIVKNDGTTCAPGERGRIVVTSLYPSTMPLLRFDTGDLAIFAQTPCACGATTPSIEQLEGRASDWIVTPSGKRFSPFYLYGVVNALGVSEYQLVQRSTGDLHIILPSEEILSPAQRTYLDEEFMLYFREAVPYKIVNTGNFERTASGKRNAFVQELSGAVDFT